MVEAVGIAHPRPARHKVDITACIIVVHTAIIEEHIEVSTILDANLIGFRRGQLHEVAKESIFGIVINEHILRSNLLCVIEILVEDILADLVGKERDPTPSLTKQETLADFHTAFLDYLAIGDTHVVISKAVGRDLPLVLSLNAIADFQNGGIVRITIRRNSPCELLLIKQEILGSGLNYHHSLGVIDVHLQPI